MTSTVFPRINARGVYFKIRDFRGRSFEGGVYSRGRLFQNLKNSGNRIWTYKNKKTFMPVNCVLQNDASAGIQSLQTSIEINSAKTHGTDYRWNHDAKYSDN